MSLPELAERIAASLQRSTVLLQQLLQGLQARRTAWISARPSTMAAPALALEQLTAELRDEDGRRGELLAAAAALLPPRPGVAAVDRHVRVSQLSGLLPRAADELRRAAAAATAAGNAVRIELKLGERLLRFSQRAHDTLLHGIAAGHDDVGGYDRCARRVHGALRTTGTAAGQLIDGRM